jgi:hypothetical protein
LLRACKESSIFRLASAGYDARYDRREDVCSAIDVERLVFVSEKEITSDDRSSVRPREIIRVHVKKKMHVAGVVGDAIIAPG